MGGGMNHQCAVSYDSSHGQYFKNIVYFIGFSYTGLVNSKFSAAIHGTHGVPAEPGSPEAPEHVVSELWYW